MKQTLKRLWRLWFFAVYAFWVLFFYPMYWLSGKYPKIRWLTHWGRSWTSRVGALNSTGIRLTVEERARIDWSKPYVLCSNHSSSLDINVCLVAIPQFFIFMSKIELARMPVFGVFSRVIDIPVDRSNPRESMKAFFKGIDELKAGNSVMVYAEGGITGEPYHKLSEFKDGAFIMATKAQVPILPITLLNNWNVLPEDENWGQPGHVKVVIHPPVEVDGLGKKDIPDLKKRVFDTINEPLLAFENEQEANANAN